MHTNDHHPYIKMYICKAANNIINGWILLYLSLYIVHNLSNVNKSNMLANAIPLSHVGNNLLNKTNLYTVAFLIISYGITMYTCPSVLLPFIYRKLSTSASLSLLCLILSNIELYSVIRSGSSLLWFERVLYFACLRFIVFRLVLIFLPSFAINRA